MSTDRLFGANLKRLRLLKGWSGERLAAEAGVGSKGYVSELETGKRPIPPGRALDALARALDTTVEELVGSDLTEAPEVFVPIVGHIGADKEGAIVRTPDNAHRDRAPIPAGGTGQAAALEVVGDAMSYLAPNGALVYFENARTPPTKDMIGYYCILETEDGRLLYKRLLRGSAPGLYVLVSPEGPPIEDVKIVWAAEPIALTPPKQAQKIIRRAGERQVA